MIGIWHIEQRASLCLPILETFSGLVHINEMESQDLSWASLDQSDSHVSSASLQLSRESLSTSESQPVEVDLLGGDLALSDDSSKNDESDEVDSDSDSEESEVEGEVDKNMEDLSCRIKELGAKLDEPLKQGWRRECLLDGEKVTSTTTRETKLFIGI